ncbi:MAG: hypothetical protein ACE5I7_11190 [Candidatus Binatia bacterium]
MSARLIEALQFLTLGAMWVFATAVTLWVLRLARVAYQLKDAFTASVGISLVAIPVFWILAAILTYTFFGLRGGRQGSG